MKTEGPRKRGCLGRKYKGGQCRDTRRRWQWERTYDGCIRGEWEIGEDGGRGKKKSKIDEWRGARGVRERESRLGVVALPLDCY